MISKDILEEVKVLTNRDNYASTEEIIADLIAEVYYLKDKLGKVNENQEDYDYHEDSVLGLL